MHNWGVDIKELKKNKKQLNVWKLEQMINFGADGKKIRISQLKKYWSKLRLDPAKRKFLNFLIWGKKSLHKSS